MVSDYPLFLETVLIPACVCVYVRVLNLLKALLTIAWCEVEINITLNDNFTSPITY